MTDERLDELDWLAAAATPGPWTPAVDTDRGYRGDDYGRWWSPTFNECPFSLMCMDDLESQAMKDANFIAAARSAVPELVAELRRLRAAVAAEREAVAAELDTLLSKRDNNLHEKLYQDLRLLRGRLCSVASHGST